MMKKKMKVSMDPPPPIPFLDGEGPSASFKYQILLQDYHELLKETEEKKARLNKAIQIKLKLLAEVKFLSKKYQSFSNMPPAKPSRTKKPSHKQAIQPRSSLIEATLNGSKHKSKKVPVQSASNINDLGRIKVPLKQRNYKSKVDPVPSSPMLLDLNQASLPNGEETEDMEMKWDPVRMGGSLKRSLTDHDDIKLSSCRDFGGINGRAAGWGTRKFHGKISTL